MSETPSALAALRSIQTLGELFAWRVGRTPRCEAYRQFDPARNEWISFSWEHVRERVGVWQRAIGSMELSAGARVGILLPNGVEAVCVDQAVLALGLVPVPMHALDNPASIGYILNDCQVELLVVNTSEQWRAIEAGAEALPSLRLVVLAERTSTGREAPPAQASGPQVTTMQTWLASESTNWAPPRHVVGEDLAAIVYTSGTTGKPKGVMLTHNNVMANLRAVLARVAAGPNDVFLSFLPLSHTFERTAGYYLPMAAGSCVAYSRSVALLAEDFQVVRPTVLISVPRIYERFYSALEQRRATSGILSRWLMDSARRVGWRRFCRAQAMPDAGGSALFDALAWPLLDRLVAVKVRALLGGRLRAAVSGGAPLSPAVAQCFLGLGVPLLQGYGMTETSPVVAANGVDDNWPATVGRPLDGVRVRIGEDSELQVRAASQMAGYWGRPEDSLRALTGDGWLRTGDQAVIEDGRIRIVGRIKDILVTSTGEKMAAADIEQAVTADALFEQVMAIGENRSFISVIVVLNAAQWRLLAPRLQLDPADPASQNAPAARAELLKRLKLATAALPHYAAPRAVWASPAPWTVENSLMTPTLKLKRNNLLARYSAEIEAMYSARPAAKAAVPG